MVFKKVVEYDYKYLLFILINLVVAGCTPIIYILLTQSIVNAVQLSNKDVYVYVFVYIFLQLFESLYGSFSSYYRTKVNLEFNLKIKKMILEKISRLSLRDFENSTTYDYINRAKNESEGKILNFIEQISTIVSSIITVVSFIITLFLFKMWIIPLILVVPILKFIISKKLNVLSFNIVTKRTNDVRKAWYIQYLLTYGDFFKELKTYALHGYFIRKFFKYNQRFNSQDIEIARKNMIYIGSMTIIELLIDGFLFYKVVEYGFLGVILIGNVMTYISTITKSKNKIEEILQTMANLNKDSLFLDQLIYLFRLEESVEENLLKIEEIEKIELKNLYYKYENSDHNSLENINLVLNKGQKLAIVGENGSGKTTLIKIILGLYDNYEGEIFINGINLKTINKEIYLRKIGVLFQDFIKYEATFRENISYGDLGYLDENSYLEELCEKFDISLLVNSSKKGLDTQIGYWFDEGKQISLGEWQKTSLARAFIKNADVYILDEPNASLDAISAHKIESLYKTIFEEKIGIMVVHKFKNIVEEVDEIIVLNRGKIEERGNHEQLVNLKGKYWKLYTLQK